MTTLDAAALPPPLLHSAFYRFVPLADAAAVADAVRGLGQGLPGLLGAVVLAPEGISGAVAGPVEAVTAFEAALLRLALPGDARDARAPGGVFQGMVFKRSACTVAPFGRLKVGVKPELVALGLPDATAGGAAPGLPAPDEQDASHLAPAAWRALLARGDAVVLDNRNHFEYRLGHFHGAVDPGVHNFRDFVAYVEAEAPAWRAAGRPVAMYCTGGIRCDKTAPWLRSLGLTVWQLQGGILHYFEALEDAGRDWQGECFVFDRRIALDTRLWETPTTAEDVYDPTHPDEAWRLQRARRLGDG